MPSPVNSPHDISPGTDQEMLANMRYPIYHLKWGNFIVRDKLKDVLTHPSTCLPMDPGILNAKHNSHLAVDDLIQGLLNKYKFVPRES